MAHQIKTGTSEKQRMFELPAGEPWTPFMEEVNDLMLEEKQARHENDHVKVSDICLRIVSTSWPSKYIWLTPVNVAAAVLRPPRPGAC